MSDRTKLKHDLDEARAALADALSRVPSSLPISMSHVVAMREALEACAKAFDAVSQHMGRD